jgi:Transposase DDE domain group 1
MATECSAERFEFARVEGRSVVAGFDGGKTTSDAGGLLLGASDRAIGLIERFAGCFTDSRSPELIEHTVATLVGQRIFGIALGYEDELRHDPMMAELAGKLATRRKNCAPVAGKSTLNRLELGKPEPTPYHKIGHDQQAIENLLVDLFAEAHAHPPRQIFLDLDATDGPLHGHQEGRFFHGYYDCYCYLPLYIFCGRHLVAAKLRRSSIDASAGAVEEVTRIVGHLRAPLAARAHLVARRRRVCPRPANALVRAQRRRFPVWPGQECAPDGGDRCRIGRRAPTQRANRQASTALQGSYLVDAG